MIPDDWVWLAWVVSLVFLGIVMYRVTNPEDTTRDVMPVVCFVTAIIIAIVHFL